MIFVQPVEEAWHEIMLGNDFEGIFSMNLTNSERQPGYSDRAYRRLIGGLLCSLLLHVLLLSLQFGVKGVDVSGLTLPWAEREKDAVSPPLSIQLG